MSIGIETIWEVEGERPHRIPGRCLEKKCPHGVYNRAYCRLCSPELVPDKRWGRTEAEGKEYAATLELHRVLDPDLRGNITKQECWSAQPGDGYFPDHTPKQHLRGNESQAQKRERQIEMQRTLKEARLILEWWDRLTVTERRDEWNEMEDKRREAKTGGLSLLLNGKLIEDCGEPVGRSYLRLLLEPRADWTTLSETLLREYIDEDGNTFQAGARPCGVSKWWQTDEDKIIGLVDASRWAQGKYDPIPLPPPKIIADYIDPPSNHAEPYCMFYRAPSLMLTWKLKPASVVFSLESCAEETRAIEPTEWASAVLDELRTCEHLILKSYRFSTGESIACCSCNTFDNARADVLNPLRGGPRKTAKGIRPHLVTDDETIELSEAPDVEGIQSNTQDGYTSGESNSKWNLKPRQEHGRTLDRRQYEIALTYGDQSVYRSQVRRHCEDDFAPPLPPATPSLRHTGLHRALVAFPVREIQNRNPRIAFRTLVQHGYGWRQLRLGQSGWLSRSWKPRWITSEWEWKKEGQKAVETALDVPAPAAYLKRIKRDGAGSAEILWRQATALDKWLVARGQAPEWTGDHTRILELVEAGTAHGAIAKNFGMSVRWVEEQMRVLRAYGFDTRKNPPVRQHSMYQTAARNRWQAHLNYLKVCGITQRNWFWPDEDVRPSYWNHRTHVDDGPGGQINFPIVKWNRLPLTDFIPSLTVTAYKPKHKLHRLLKPGEMPKSERGLFSNFWNCDGRRRWPYGGRLDKKTDKWILDPNATWPEWAASSCPVSYQRLEITQVKPWLDFASGIRNESYLPTIRGGQTPCSHPLGPYLYVTLPELGYSVFYPSGPWRQSDCALSLCAQSQDARMTAGAGR